MDYLGMNFNFGKDGEVKITMADHVEKIIKSFTNPFRNKKISSPNTPKLFKTRNNKKKLSEKQEQDLSQFGGKTFIHTQKNQT